MKPRLVIGSIVIGVVLCDDLGAQVLEPDFGISATFSIVAVEPETGTCGAAVASKYPAVGKVVTIADGWLQEFAWRKPERTATG